VDLFIVRHGEAGPAVSDASRELTEAGGREVEQIASAVGKRGVEVAQIRHSGRVRARQTAQILADVLKPPQGLAEMPGLHPDDPVEPLAQSLFGERDSLMLVGHLPFVARLTGLLVHGDEERAPVQFPTAAVACLRGEDDRWELSWVLHPS
jgi:phosphohistidine phosphatase